VWPCGAVAGAGINYDGIKVQACGSDGNVGASSIDLSKMSSGGLVAVSSEGVGPIG